MKLVKYLCIGSSIILTGCVAPPPKMTPLEIQSLQTKEFENDESIVFMSVISVFQDLGYTIKGADKETGFITAESLANSAMLWTGDTVISQTSATAIVEKIGKFTRVRINFVTNKTQSSESGQSHRNDIPILDATIYQNAFERIENAIFVRGAN